jgi:hypothetical protein
VSDAEALAKLVHNEQMKLGATLFNNVAVAFVVTGLVVPVIAFTYGTSLPRSPYRMAYAMLWVAMAAVNHQIARSFRSRMRP